MGEYEVNSELATASPHRDTLPGMAPEGDAPAERNHPPAARRRTFRLLTLLLALAMPLVNLTLLDQYREGVIRRVPHADAAPVKVGVASAWVFGSVLNALGMLFVVLIAGAAGAAACRLAGSQGAFADDRALLGVAVSGFLLGKLLLLTLGSVLFSLPTADHIAAVLGGVDPSMAVLAAACTCAVRHSARLSWPRGTACALVPTALLAVVCLVA
ncbi:hypothetical protein ABB07_26080 [Streptomyces incarnatus]|uniref:Yip1 domain-containing protein n=2 Tax=Streptomyces incarnatus TaxID=665007 RepID=A0ABM5TQZ8_9ACTN|nr:hypothetical protein ABB07_26080 [Streptomyces incarnatus]